MDKARVQQIIQELASQNFDMYPENYPVENGLFTDEAAINLQELAKGYFDNRGEEEIERDSSLGIALEDYAVWVGEQAREEFIEEHKVLKEKIEKCLANQDFRALLSAEVGIDYETEEYNEEVPIERAIMLDIDTEAVILVQSMTGKFRESNFNEECISELLHISWEEDIIEALENYL